MRGLSVALLVLALGGAAWGQTPKPSMAVVPLEIEPHPSLKKVEAELRTTWFDGLRDSGKLLLPTKRELEAAYASLKKQDCRESNECMTKLAQKAGTLYAIYAEVGYSETKVVSVTARLVRDDGKVMGSLVVQAPRGKQTIVEVARRLYLETFEKLRLTELPTFKEAAGELPPVKHDPDPVELKPPEKKNDLPPPPPPPLADTGKGARMAGTALLLGGAAAFAVGVTLTSAGLAMGYGADANHDGNIDSPARVADVATGQTLSTSGFIVGGVSVVAAGIGAVLALTAPEPPKTSVTFVPLAGGGAIQIGGRF